ncbi:MAG: hypothetical protein CME71_01550 [Halobacteriovorax sp.]|nr:hypothetical protein [Halobacteriovorax sp.]|tara:strand:+ start:30 stop:1097 length:1068 start_codon:yes stop_codon:yes gene_type:complete
MLSRLIIFISLLPNLALSKVDWSSELAISSNATYVESSTQQARSFGVIPELKLSVTIKENLIFHSKASAILETGSFKGTLVDEFKPDQQVLLNYGYFSYKPFSLSQIEFGALPMNTRAPQILIASGRFLGAELLQSIPLWGEAKLNLYALSAIPSNQELTNRLGGVSEGTPGYQQLGLDLNLPGDLVAIGFKAFAWNYNNVTGNVAYQSGFMGNQTQGIGSSNTRFSYEYEGLGSSLQIKGETQSFKWGLTTDFIYNDAAPDTRNQALRVSPSVTVSDHQISLSWFEIEADSAIGYYNEASYGHTNRTGISLDYFMPLGKEESFGLSMARSKTLKATLLQSDQDVLKMWWRLQLK